MEIVKFSWLFCGRRSLKNASVFTAIIGITLAIAILGIAAGEKFFLDLMDGVVFLVEAISFLVNNIFLNYLHYLAVMDGVVFLVEGILLVIYNIFLLNTVKKNEASQVFQDHQSGLHNVALRLADLEYRSVSDLPDCRICINSPSERRAWQSGLPGNFQNGCPPRCPVFIYILIFLILVLAVFAAFHYSSLVMILKWVFTMLWLFYCLFLFSLHRNMMII